MKILKLSFRNINSLKGDNEIDFTKSPLADTGIFAIIGPTGSGKSTILDAISLALYNRTPRTGTLSKTAMENFGSIITRRTYECFSEIEYEVNGKQYRSKWSVHKAKKSGAVQDYHMELATLHDNKIFDLKRREVSDKNAEIIGLNYDQFVKSILLSQGEFAKFLKASVSERGELLEKITGTEIYRQIGRAAFEKQKEEKQNLEKLNDKIKGIITFTDDEVLGLENRETELNKLLLELSELLDKANNLYQVKCKINGLIQDNENLSKKFNSLLQLIEGFKTNLDKLDKHNSLVNLKGEISDLKNEINNKTKLESKLKSLIAKLNKLLIAEKETFENVDICKEKLRKEEKEYEFKRPVFAQTRELDNQLKISKDRITDERKLLVKKETENNLQIKQSENLKKKIIADTNQQKAINVWLDENKLLEELVRELSLFENEIKLLDIAEKDAEKVLDEKNKSSVFLTIKNENNWQKRAEFITAAVDKNILTINNLKVDLKYHKNDLSALNIEIEALRNKVSDLDKQTERSAEYTKYTTKFGQAQSQIKISEEQTEVNIREKTKYTNEQEIVQKLIEELRIKIERQQLEAKYEDDRKKLKESQACYLCGSTTHPYVKHYVSELGQTKKELKLAEQENQNISKQIQKFDKDIAKADTQIVATKKQVDDINVEVKSLKELFDKTNKKNDLDIEIDNIIAIKELRLSIMSNGKELKRQKDKLEKVTVIDLEQQQLSYLNEKVTVVLNNRVGVKLYFQKYRKYLGNVKDKQKFLPTLKSNILEFEDRKKKLSKLELDINANEKLVTEKIGFIESIVNELKIITANIAEKEQSYNKIKKERISLLGEKNVDKAEEEIRTEIKLQTEKTSDQENKLTRQQAEVKSLQNNEIEITNELKKSEGNTEQKSNKLLPKISALGYNSIDQALDNILDEALVGKIREKDKKLNNDKISVEQSIKDKQKELTEQSAKDNTELSIREVEQNIADSKAKTQNFNQEIGLIKNRLQEDKKRKDASEQLRLSVDKQNKEFDRWNTLNILIGDAEGKKFSKFAQELTLVQLLALANKHLKSLNDRYSIKKGDEKSKDDLIVIDFYQGNSERSVRTLSGGESFLVSMSLALGLSDLAGKNTKIESLFIDEGFGSLDQETLDLALSSLEKLQSETNRTIGIISHVESLKERIKTQIELKKSNSGYSQLTVNGF